MPQAVAGVAVTALGLTGTTAVIVGAGIQVGAGLLIAGAANQLFAPDLAEPGQQQQSGPQPQDGTVVFSGTNGARTKHYGTVVVGGHLVFQRSVNGFLYRVIVHGVGPIDGFVEMRLDGRQHQVEADGRVLTAPYNAGVDGSLIRIETRKGLVPQQPLTGPTAAAPSWGTNHRLDGLVATYSRTQQRLPENQQASYPNGAPALQWKLRGSPLKDPRTTATLWTDNAALVLADWIEGPDGFNRPGAMDVEDLASAANKADQLRPLVSGGSTRAWRLCGSASLADRKGSVLDQMLASCAGEIRLNPNGKLSLSIGGDDEPTVTITDDDIVEFITDDDGPDALDRFTELTVTYQDETLDFAETTAEVWRNEPAAVRYNEDSQGSPFQARFAPYHAQARHVAKIMSARQNPPRRAVLRLFPEASLRVMFERVVTLDVEALGMQGTWRVEPWQASLEDMTLTVRLSQVEGDPSAWSVVEEGLPIAAPPAQNDTSNPPAQPTGAQAFGQTVAGRAGIVMAADEPVFEDTRHYWAWSEAGSNSWSPAPQSPGLEFVSVSGLADGGLYDVAVIAARSEIYDPNDPNVTDVRIVSVEARDLPATPVAPTALTVSDAGSGTAIVQLAASASSFVRWTEILRDGEVVERARSAAGSALTVPDYPGPGTYTYQARGVSISGALGALSDPIVRTIS